MTRTEKRNLDSIFNFIMNIAGAIGFGVYMHSFWLSIVGYTVLHGLLNLSWAIEYGHDE